MLNCPTRETDSGVGLYPNARKSSLRSSELSQQAAAPPPCWTRIGTGGYRSSIARLPEASFPHQNLPTSQLHGKRAVSRRLRITVKSVFVIGEPRTNGKRRGMSVGIVTVSVVAFGFVTGGSQPKGGPPIAVTWRAAAR